MNNRIYKIIISILVIYIISLLSFSGCNNTPKVLEIEKVRVDTLLDTAYIQQPPVVITKYKQVPKYITEVKHDTIKENTILVTENKTYIDSICTKDNDSIFLKNIIQGVNANLLLTEVTLKKQDKVITNTITIEKVVKNNKRIAFGPSVTAGYDFVNKQCGIMAGFSLIYRL